MGEFYMPKDSFRKKKAPEWPGLRPKPERRKTMVQKYNIASGHLTTIIDGQLYMVDYPSARDMAGLMIWLLLQADVPLAPLSRDVWKQYTAGQNKEMRNAAREDIHAAFSKAEDAERILAWKENPFLIRTVRTNGNTDLVLSTALDLDRNDYARTGKSLTVCTHFADGNEKPVYTRFAASGIRPVLIPLNNDGSYACAQFQKTHPSGTTLRLGTIYREGEPMLTSQGTQLLTKDSNFCIDETDSEETALEWICWEGKLIAANTMFLLYPQDITALLGKIVP